MILCALQSFCSAKVDISAHSAIIIAADSREVIYEKNADERHLIASTTKIMTALVALDELDQDAVVSVPHEAVLVGGSSMYLKEGELISVRGLLYGLLLQSGNDAAYTIASACGGTDVFADKMNDKARSLGLLDTHFVNPHGLDDESHYSTAKDVALLAAYALENDDFLSICSCKSTKIGQRYMTNHNKLLSMYEGTIGVKTGFTKAAGRCLVSAVNRQGRTFVCVTLNASDDWNDHIKLYDDTFSILRSYNTAACGETAVFIPLAAGGKVKACYADGFDIMLAPGEEEKLRWEYECPKFLYNAPAESTNIGCAELYLGDVLIKEIELITE